MESDQHLQVMHRRQALVRMFRLSEEQDLKVKEETWRATTVRWAVAIVTIFGR